MQIRLVGIDLGKTTFHLVALGDNGKVLLKKKFTASSTPKLPIIPAGSDGRTRAHRIERGQIRWLRTGRLSLPLHGVDQSGFADTALTMPASDLEHPNVNLSKPRGKVSETRVNSNN